MKRNKLYAMRHYARKVQKIAYETRECIGSECKNCNCSDICETVSLLIKYILHEINRYEAKGELKDDNN